MYKITQQQCQKSIDDRMPIVCSSCGGKIEPIETVDNSNNPTFWSGCLSCNMFDSGVSPEIFKTAEKMVDERNFRAYSFDKMPDKNENMQKYEYWREGQIRGTTRIVMDILEINNKIKQSCKQSQQSL